MFEIPARGGCSGVESIAAQIKRLPDDEIDALEEREGILRDALNSFMAYTGSMTERDKRAALSLLYKDVAERVFDFHLSLITLAARERIAHAPTREAKIIAMREFQATAGDLAMIHGVGR